MNDLNTKKFQTIFGANINKNSIEHKIKFL